MGREQGESKKCKSNKKNRSTPNTSLQQLEAEIPTSRTKLKTKKREGMIQPNSLLYPRQNPHKPLTHLGRAQNERLKRDGHW
jgi:hypothetical protein